MGHVINHIAIKVDDLEAATTFYEEVFGFRQLKTGSRDGHMDRRAGGFRDHEIPERADLEAQLAGPGPCIHHWCVEVDDRAAFAEKIRKAGGEVLTTPEKGAWKFRAPDGTLAEIVVRGAFEPTA